MTKTEKAVVSFNEIVDRMLEQAKECLFPDGNNITYKFNGTATMPQIRVYEWDRGAFVKIRVRAICMNVKGDVIVRLENFDEKSLSDLYDCVYPNRNLLLAFYWAVFENLQSAEIV